MAVPDDVVRRIERHFANEGTVIFIRPVLFDFSAPGARQYRVSLAIPYRMSLGRTVEVDKAGQVHTVF
jgi:hypothetical protein